VFVAAELSLVAADRSKLEHEARSGDRAAGMAVRLMRRLARTLSGTQLGVTACSIGLGILSEPVIARLLEPLLDPVLPSGAASAVAIVVALAIATVAEMVLGELVPKTLAIASPEPTARRIAPFLRLWALAFGPAIAAIDTLARSIVRRFGIEPKDELSSVTSLSELALVVQASAQEGELDQTASRLLTRSIRFGEKTAADVLVPRVELVAISADATLAELVRLAIGSGHSRLVVYGSDLDDIVGVIHVKQVHAVPTEQRATTTVASLMHDVMAVPETRDLESLLVEMRERREHLAVVVDEYGGTAGIVTLEDIMEEIVGEIDDEYDVLTPSLTEHLAAGTYRLSGGLHPDEVLEASGLQLPDGEFETLAGFVLERLGHLPVEGESFEYRGWTIAVDEMDRRRVAWVRLTAPSTGAVDVDVDAAPDRDGRP
jgi:CBS domain containing-hemolysin-like protein